MSAPTEATGRWPRRVEPNPLAGVPCRDCGEATLHVEVRLEAKPLGTWSLAGHQPKTVAREWPWAVCGSCGGESRGKR